MAVAMTMDSSQVQQMMMMVIGNLMFPHARIATRHPRSRTEAMSNPALEREETVGVNVQ